MSDVIFEARRVSSLRRGVFGTGQARSLRRGVFGTGQARSLRHGGFGTGQARNLERGGFGIEQPGGLGRGHFGKKAFALEEISFQLPRGYIMGLIGKNGAGKTTFFDCIMDEKKRYSGEMFLEGSDIHEDHLQFLDKTGFISEKNEFLELRTAGQNARMLGRFYSGFDMELFQGMMERCRVSSGKTVGKMSRGETVKFQLAFAVAHRPRLYLLDEATAGMDPVFRIDFYRILHELLKDGECGIILSTHLEEEIEKQLDYVGVLEEGRLVSFGENMPM